MAHRIDVLLVIQGAELGAPVSQDAMVALVESIPSARYPAAREGLLPELPHVDPRSTIGEDPVNADRYRRDARNLPDAHLGERDAAGIVTSRCGARFTPAAVVTVHLGAGSPGKPPDRGACAVCQAVPS